jgi:hypothetical protein
LNEHASCKEDYLAQFNYSLSSEHKLLDGNQF